MSTNKIASSCLSAILDIDNLLMVVERYWITQGAAIVEGCDTEAVIATKATTATK